MKKSDQLKNNILLSITGRIEKDWHTKLKDLKKYKIKRIALFLEIFNKKQRERIYKALLDSQIKDIPLVHIKDDMTKDDLKFLQSNFRTKCFNIHEDHFKIIKKWQGYYQNIYLEMNYNNIVKQFVKVRKIGGFCIDLSHFKAAQERNTKEYSYIEKRKKIHKYFKCNHLNGYDEKKKIDLHTVTNLRQFNYLKTLPDYLFGKYIGLEVFNSIDEQQKFKDYIIKLFK